MEDIIPELIKFRRHLHQYPELSSQERKSSAFILKSVKSCDPDQIVEFDNYGIAVIFKGKIEGKNMLIRGDFDALPIEEINDFEYKSKNEGVSHKCGHDGHAAILYGLVRHYQSNRPEKGDIILLFQPGEETGEGAKGIVEDAKFKNINIDYALALHNLPGYKKHSIIYKRGIFTAAANSMIIKLKGKTSHAGEPELGRNPAVAIAKIITEYSQLIHPDPEDRDFKLITPIYATLGERSYGVSAGHGEVHFTLRAWQNKVMSDLEERCEKLAKEIGKAHQLEVDVEWIQSFHANENDTEVVDAIEVAAKTLKLEHEEKEVPFKWGEDFGLFTSRFKGAMFGLGAGVKMPALHNPDYDFPDELIQTGVKMFAEIQRRLS